VSAVAHVPDPRSYALREIRDAQRFVLVTHENPDGDALGSLVGMQHLLTALGKDSLMYIAPEEFPLPYEYRFFDLEGLVSIDPQQLSERTIVFLDCGNIDRNPADALKHESAHILNLDHHHDNTHFGTVNLVVPEASCTAEIVWDLARELGVAVSGPMADALYVGLVTDTGRFMYENTTPRAHLMAAELVKAGVDVHGIYRRLYEDLPFPRLELLGRALGKIRRFDDGLLTLTTLTTQDYAAAGAEESHSEGVIDHLRAVEGTTVAALVRDMLAPDRQGTRKVSLRAADGRVDVSLIAREQGGGGHPQAAGFTTLRPVDEVIEFLRGAIAAQLAPHAPVAASVVPSDPAA
jgi:bifunctional oligoribonuclease and PAP phosphatase NrnA